jgi:GNAT superfamily N-acetyltransferase
VTATARFASPSDLDILLHLYRILEEEMVALSDLWPLTDGLAEPVGETWAQVLADPDHVTVLGFYEDHPFGFMMARVERHLPQAGDLRIGSIRLVFVDIEARAVGIGEAMRNTVLAELRNRGVSRFDAHVLPGHRLAKNFFEQGGFSARHIVMHHDDADD